MAGTKRPRPVVLCVLDGWGHRTDLHNNAIRQADTPVWDRLVATCPHALLESSAGAVGLPDGQMGNSEVGHMNLGAGRIVLQDLPRIDIAVRDGTLARHPALLNLIARLRESHGTAHLMGLISPGGVHAHQSHIQALLETLSAAGIPLALHAFLDGRDTPPRSARKYLAHLPAGGGGESAFALATVSGRYYAMDRDRRWDRTARAYDAMVAGIGETAADGLAAIDQSYDRDLGDEFVLPTVIDGYAGMCDGDAVLMTNFRADRVRQILTALLDPRFTDFPRRKTIRFSAALGMTEYSAKLNAYLSTLFAPERLDNVLGKLVAEAGLTQLRIAETEKYAHVTFFFNGGEEQEFPGEQRVLVPSPTVSTYDQQPEMSAPQVTDKLVAAIDGGEFDFILANYANTDMVGHTGNLAAAIESVEAVDRCLARLTDAVVSAQGALLITSDHGNAEMMSDQTTGQAHTAHTHSPVPVILVNAPSGVAALRDGRLADVAPTLLEIMRLQQPAEMTGRSLLIEADQAGQRADEHASA